MFMAAILQPLGEYPVASLAVDLSDLCTIEEWRDRDWHCLDLPLCDVDDIQQNKKYPSFYF